MRINFIVFALAILLLTSSVVTVTFSQKVFADSQNTKSDHVKDKDKKPLPETDFGADRKQIKSKMGL